MKIKLLASSILFSSICLANAQQNTDLLNAPVAVGNYQERIKDSDLDMFRELADKHRDMVKKQKVKSPVDLQLSDDAKKVFNQYQNEAQAIQAKLQKDTARRIKNLNGSSDFIGNADMSKATYSTLVFASLSMPRSDIEDMYRSLAGATDTTIVFRGLPKGSKTINQAIAAFQQIARDMKLTTTPNVVINPVFFQQYNVTSVPTIIRLSEPTPNRSGDPETNMVKKHPKEIASVQGLISPLWLYEQIKLGKKGFLGKKGPMYAIEELDLIEELQKRAKEIDWDKKKKEAYARIWKNVPFEELTPAVINEKRIVDPTFELKQDIKDIKGNIIAQQGTVVNPLTVRNFDRLLVVFDPTNARELKFIERHLPQWKLDHHTNTNTTHLIMTGFDREKGWDEHNRLVQRFNSRLYFLQNDVKNTFRLRHHPSIVYQQRTNFIVEEFKID